MAIALQRRNMREEGFQALRTADIAEHMPALAMP
jgi:hypothetical protein